MGKGGSEETDRARRALALTLHLTMSGAIVLVMTVAFVVREWELVVPSEAFAPRA